MTSNFSKLYRAATVVTVCGTVMFFLAVAQMVVWAMERTPPFTVLGYVAAPVRAGDTAIVSARVRRDLDRLCSVTYSRVLIDGKGVVFDLTEGVRLMTAQALAELDKRSPDKITFSVNIPVTASAGPGAVITAMEYQCNPIHQAKPIPVIMVSKVEILGGMR